MKKQTSVAVTFDDAIKARLDAYCELNDIDAQAVITEAVATFLKSQAPEINQYRDQSCFLCLRERGIRPYSMSDKGAKAWMCP